ncbi:MAG: DUF927 domain-containing protein [Nitrospirae bacterium]|nr:DUF927 domain-containing protein [Nitrospirota bacterium]
MSRKKQLVSQDTIVKSSKKRKYNPMRKFNHAVHKTNDGINDIRITTNEIGALNPSYMKDEEILNKLEGLSLNFNEIVPPIIENKKQELDLLDSQYSSICANKVSNNAENDVEHENTETTVATSECTDHASNYTVDDEGYLCLIQNNVLVRLCNCDIRIVKEVIEDNGEEIKHYLELAAITKQKHLRKVIIPASQFRSLNLMEHWGNDFILEPGSRVKDYIRHAIQERSRNVYQSRCYTHTGWCKNDGDNVFLTNKGAIGGGDIDVKLPDDIRRYNIPQTPIDEMIAVKTSLSFIEIGPKEITLPLFVFTYMAPLTTLLDPQPNFSLYLHGETGCYKSTLSILALSHFGYFQSITSLSNFGDTANALEEIAFTLKDVLMVLDDYHPSANKVDGDDMESKAQRLIRACSNRTGRGRMTDKRRHVPRCGLLITGEEMVSIPSTLARIMVLELAKGDIDITRLTELQEQAYLLPHAMSSFINWLIVNLDWIRFSFPDEFIRIRAMANKCSSHAKSSEQVTFLTFTLNVVIQWLLDGRVITDSEAESLKNDGFNLLTKVVERNSARIDAEDPVKIFISTIENLISKNKVSLKHKTENEYIGKGDFLGWYDDKHLYLLPQPTWDVVKHINPELAVTKNALYDMLNKRGFIEKGEKSTSVERLDGATRRVLKLKRNGLSLESVKGEVNECKV